MNFSKISSIAIAQLAIISMHLNALPQHTALIYVRKTIDSSITNMCLIQYLSTSLLNLHLVRPSKLQIYHMPPTIRFSQGFLELLTLINIFERLLRLIKFA